MTFLHKQLDNCILALNLWREHVKPKDVSFGLYRWRCGTQACFGGHLAYWEEFRKLGVLHDSDGAPYLLEDWTQHPGVVAGYLFGDSSLFKMTGHCDFDREPEMGVSMAYNYGVREVGIDISYEVVIHRLERQISFLKAILGEYP